MSLFILLDGSGQDLCVGEFFLKSFGRRFGVGF